MDYILGFALTFKCIFYYDFISIFFIWTQYMIQMGKKYGLKKFTTKNLTEKITMDFWMTKFKPYFKSPYLGHFLLD